MVLQSAAHRVFSRPTQCFERFGDSSNIPWDQPTTFHPNRIADVTQRFLLSLCTPLPARQHHVSQNDDALMYNDSRIDLHNALPKSCDFFEKVTFWLAFGSRTVWRLFSVSCEVLVLQRWACNRLEADPLPQRHTCDCTAIHIPQWELCDPLWSRHQFFCPRYLVTGAFSARHHRNFGPFAYFAISVFREVRKNAMLSRDHLWWRFGMRRLVRAACLRFPNGGSFCIH